MALRKSWIKDYGVKGSELENALLGTFNAYAEPIKEAVDGFAK